MPDLLKDDGTAVTDDMSKAELLASFSSQCSNGISDNRNEDILGAPYRLLEDQPVFKFRPISVGEVKILLHLPVRKSSGGYATMNRIFIAQSLTNLFNHSITSGIFHGKNCNCYTHFKNRGDPRQPTNYCPVLILHLINIGKIRNNIQSRRL